MQVSPADLGQVKPWSITQRCFSDGERELTIREGNQQGIAPAELRHLVRVAINRKKAAVAAGAPADGTEATRQRNLRRARVMVRHKVKTAGLDYMLTLTYRENMTDPDRLRRDWDLFRRRLRNLGRFDYVAIVERQKRGAFHLHIAVRGRQNVRVLRSIWRSVVGDFQGKPGGNVDVRSPFKERALRHKLAQYLSKYLGKAFAELDAGKHRYWCSKGIHVPPSSFIAWPASTWPEIVSAVLATLPRGRLLCYMHDPTLTLCINLTETVS